MIMTSRNIFSDNGSLNDISLVVNDFRSGSFNLPFVSAEDYLYIGSDFPFNHRYIDVETANDQAALLSVALWDGQDWKNAVDIIDETSVAGIPLSQSGNVSWRIDDRESWFREDTNNEGDKVTGLDTLKIFDMYWARLKWSADLNAATSINFIGHRFSDDDDLETFYPVLTESDVKSQFKSGKTNWKEQQFQASVEIIRDLKKKQVIISSNQILEWGLFRDASSHKVAQIAYNSFGPDYYDRRDEAKKAYYSALNQSIYLIDEDNDAKLDVHERKSRQGFMSR